MRPDKVGKRIVEVASWLICGAKWAVSERRGAVLQIQQAALEINEASAESLVGWCKGVARSSRSHTIEEDVDGDLKSAFSEVEQVLRRKDW